MSAASHQVPPTPRKNQGRWPELDALRFFAVLGVMFVHFSPAWLARYGAWGKWGVGFFFVLSGFLITQILLAWRQKLDSGQSTLSRAAGHFFLRRILRLWPLYYLTLCTAAALNVAFARGTFWWHATFLTNYYVEHTGGWPELLSHFWTLAAEQQFYLLWPWLILLLPRRWLPSLFGLFILAGAGFRLWAPALGLASSSGVNYTLPACSDYFAWGAILAWYRTNGAEFSPRRSRLALGVFGVGTVVLVAGFVFKSGDSSPHLRDAWTGTVCAAASAALIFHCIAATDSVLKRALRWPVLVYLGSISYGIYVLHNFAHWVGPRLLRHLIGRAYFAHESAHVAYLIALSLLMAAASWQWIERPFNNIRVSQ